MRPRPAPPSPHSGAHPEAAAGPARPHLPGVLPAWAHDRRRLPGRPPVCGGEGSGRGRQAGVRESSAGRRGSLQPGGSEEARGRGGQLEGKDVGPPSGKAGGSQSNRLGCSLLGRWETSSGRPGGQGRATETEGPAAWSSVCKGLAPGRGKMGRAGAGVGLGGGGGHTRWSTFHKHSFSRIPQPPFEAGPCSPILQMSKLRFREVRPLPKVKPPGRKSRPQPQACATLGPALCTRVTGRAAVRGVGSYPRPARPEQKGLPGLMLLKEKCPIIR